jgi:hypothetical protein
MSVSAVASVAPATARAVQKNDGDKDDMQAQAPKAAPKAPDGDADDGVVSGATKAPTLTSPALQSVISSLTNRG